MAGAARAGPPRRLDPLAVKAHTIFAVLRIPIDVLNAEPIRERTARPLAASEMVEPGAQRLVSVAAIVACLHGHKSTEKDEKKD